MSAKDYRLIAALLRSERMQAHTPDGLAALDALADVMAASFAAVMPTFDRARFLQAAGVTQ